MYERYIVPTLSAASAYELVTLAAVTSGERLLDVACGTGVVTRQAAQAVGPTGAVTGLDINEGMLRLARMIAPSEGVAISYCAGTALALPFPDASFDVVLCQYALEFFPNRLQGVQEMLRVLTPEGRVGLRSWGPLEHQAFHTAVLAVLDRYHWGGQPVPSRVGFAQPFSVGDVEELRGYVVEAGFRDIDIRVSTVPMRLASEPVALLGYLTALPVGSEMAAMENTHRSAILHEIMAALDPFREAGTFVIPTRSHIVLARKSA